MGVSRGQYTIFNSFRNHLAFGLVFIATLSTYVRAIDIGPMKWTPRVDWINVKDCTALTGTANAIGDGTTDDTAAIQGALTYLTNHADGHRTTIYLPEGTYKISSTLTVTGASSAQIIGCGSKTTLVWGGASGGAMFRPVNCSFMHYWGLSWDGASLASCALEFNAETNKGEYETQVRIENNSFRNFTVTGTYTYLDNAQKPKTGAPPAAIIEAFPQGGITADTLVFNCAFSHCSTGLLLGFQFTQVFEWHLDGCEFEDCGVGLNGGSGYCYIIDNTHFERSATADVTGGGSIRMRNCTSSDSNAFLINAQGTNVLQDCVVDGWHNVAGAVQLVGQGSHTIFDCIFTHPPDGAQGIVQTLGYHHPENILLSSNTADGLSEGKDFINNGSGTDNNIRTVPPGTRGGVLTSATQTFLKTTPTADGTRILDVTQDPYYADNTAKTDATSIIQAALNDAKKANDGSVVYLPTGRYRISSTLAASGGNYTIQGTGNNSELVWYGEAGKTMLAIDTPVNVTVQNFCCSPLQASKNSIGIEETATGPSSITYDGIFYTWSYDPPLAQQDNANNPGLVLTKLPARSVVYIPYLPAPLTVRDSGAAVILGRTLMGGVVSVSGIGPKTGFLGIMDLENIEQQDKNGYVIDVADNQNLVVGDHYTESDYNNVKLSRGDGTTPGHFAIQGMNHASFGNSTTLDIDNYAGRAFYGNYQIQNLLEGPGTSKLAPVKVTQTGSNAVDVILVGLNTLDGPPLISVDSGAHLINTLGCNFLNNGAPLIFPKDTPDDPLTPADYAPMTAGLDDLRQLDEIDLEIQFGIRPPARPRQ